MRAVSISKNIGRVLSASAVASRNQRYSQWLIRPPRRVRAFAELKALHNQRKEIDNKILARHRRALSHLSRKAGRYCLAQEDGGPQQCRREGVQPVPHCVDGREMTDSQVPRFSRSQRIPGTARPSGRRAEKIGAVLEADLKELVKLPNEAARKLGFKNYHALQLYLNKQQRPTPRNFGRSIERRSSLHLSYHSSRTITLLKSQKNLMILMRLYYLFNQLLVPQVKMSMRTIIRKSHTTLGRRELLHGGAQALKDNTGLDSLLWLLISSQFHQ